MLPEEIDVTEWVVDYNYKPVYCKGEITCLINPAPDSITEDEISTVKESIIELIFPGQTNIDSLIFNQTEGYKLVEALILFKQVNLQKPKYEYTYFMAYDPINVYSVNATIKDSTKLYFFRKSGDGLIEGVKENEGWVINDECD